jgi:hypothetical protein
MTSLISNLINSGSPAVDPFGRPKREEVEEYARLKAALNEEARENWHNEAWKREVAILIASRLDYGFTFENLFSTYFRTERVGEFETVEVRERRGLKVFYTSRGGYIDESQLKTERWELPRDTIGFHVSEHEDKLRANFSDTAESLVSLAEQRLDAEVNRRIFNLLQAAIPNGNPYYVSTAGLTKANLDDALRNVRDAVKPNNGVTPPVTIIGRAAMIDKISAVVVDAATLNDPDGTAEIRQKGRLGVYRGANVVQVNNYTDENDLSYIPANELWVFGGDVGKFAMYGDLQAKSWTENTVDYWHYRGRKDIGGLVHHPEQARRIVDSSVTP